MTAGESLAPQGADSSGAKKKEEGSGSSFLMSLVGLLFAGVVFAATIGNAFQIVDDIKLHSTGAVARESSCSMRASRYVAESLRVQYKTADGTAYDQNLYTLVFGSPVASGRCAVRYDPASPRHVSLGLGKLTLVRLIVFTGITLLVDGVVVLYALLIAGTAFLEMVT